LVKQQGNWVRQGKAKQRYQEYEEQCSRAGITPDAPHAQLGSPHKHLPPRPVPLLLCVQLRCSAPAFLPAFGARAGLLLLRYDCQALGHLGASGAPHTQLGPPLRVCSRARLQRAEGGDDGERGVGRVGVAVAPGRTPADALIQCGWLRMAPGRTLGNALIAPSRCGCGTRQNPGGRYPDSSV
jgi:hypothetical protein